MLRQGRSNDPVENRQARWPSDVWSSFPWRHETLKRCPHCGNGSLFKSWTALHANCRACGIKYVRNSGDPWAFLLFLDRAAFISPVVVMVYFEVYQKSFLVFTGLSAAVVLLFFLSTPNRYGLCVAIDYLTRVRWPDPNDSIPELGGERAAK